MLFIALPINLLSQNSIFDNNEVSISSIRNLSQFASTGTDAIIYNPAGLSFSASKCQISLGAIWGYQLIDTEPFIINGDGEAVYDLAHQSSILRLTPTFQAYYLWGRLTFAASMAIEGGGAYGGMPSETK